MTFNTWNNRADAQTSLDEINKAYGCPYKATNGYVMDEWDFVTKSDAGDVWGFSRAEARLDKAVEELEAVLVVGSTELAKKPSNWIAEEE